MQCATDRAEPAPDRVQKLIGADVELANFLEGAPPRRGPTGHYASRLLLREIPGIRQTPALVSGVSRAANFQDWGRKFLPCNGGSAYIDLDHLELPLPELLTATDFVAAWHAMLRIARRALNKANRRLEHPMRLQVLVNNSDGFGHSYGSHLNCLITRRAFDNLFQHKPHHLLFLAAFHASSIVITGQGKVGSENGTPPVGFQIAQRADFFETLTGIQTTYHRPLVNSRDEPLCGNSTQSPLARLHVIFYDSNLCHVACLLKIGMLQIILAMIEAEWIDPTLIVDDPVQGVIRWSHDPTLQARVKMADRRRLTAVQLQREFLERAEQFCQQGGCDQIVPGAAEILALWAEVLGQLEAGDYDALAGSLDWVLKLRCLERAVRSRPGLSWQSPELKHLDHLYSSLDPATGLYWACERAGVVRRVVSGKQIRRFVHQPPEDTRAWTRAMLLRRAGPDRISFIDWDQIRFRLARNRWGWPVYRSLWMPHPARLTKQETQHLFQSDRSLEEILDALLEDELLAPQVGDDSTGAARPDSSCEARANLPTQAGSLPIRTDLSIQPNPTKGDGNHEIS